MDMAEEPPSSLFKHLILAYFSTWISTNTTSSFIFLYSILPPPQLASSPVNIFNFAHTHFLCKLFALYHSYIIMLSLFMHFTTLQSTYIHTSLLQVLIPHLSYTFFALSSLLHVAPHPLLRLLISTSLIVIHLSMSSVSDLFVNVGQQIIFVKHIAGSNHMFTLHILVSLFSWLRGFYIHSTPTNG